MAMKTQKPIVHKTAMGKPIDMDKLRERHQYTPAIGNANVNARGDKLGPNGEIIKTKEQIDKEFYAAAVAKATLKPSIQQTQNVTEIEDTPLIINDEEVIKPVKTKDSK